ncbi:hypothetical protein ACVIEM_004501 [Rhizobium leguminosarum]
MAKRLDEPGEAVTGGAGLVAEMHAIKLYDDSLDNAAHAGIRCFNLAITDLSVPASQQSQLHSSAWQHRFRQKLLWLGLSEQPSEGRCRASHLSHEEGHTDLRFSLPGAGHLHPTNLRSKTWVTTSCRTGRRWFAGSSVRRLVHIAGQALDQQFSDLSGASMRLLLRYDHRLDRLR